MRDQYYKILNIPVNSSQEVIKNAYRKLAKKYHPDVSKEPNAEDKFIEINAAYEFLIRAPKIQKVRNKRTAEYNARKEREYKEWLKNNEEHIKNSARNKAQMNYSDWVDEEGFGSAEEFAVVKLFGCLFSVFVFACVLAFAVFITDLLGLYDTLGVGLLVIMSFLFLPCAVLLMTWLEEKKIYQRLKKRITNSFRK